ncbi:recombinase family protein [Thermocoleostomius sinensis]|uniref:Recombinase family protein n=1 Tax=Thermocoleostomius sinensis A174 TaxID=2016057 RepID=A0A9E9C6R6_9CYAN|nr:recombinase family protein [Thermocoleostomius sinensis]WAL62551.1 recombinase family protein [Thermocoleostomius sinensis A174]
MSTAEQVSTANGQTFAYSYSDPWLESVPDVSIWEGVNRSIDRIYQDLGSRQQLQQLLNDCETETVAYLVVRRLEELGDSIQAVSDCLATLERLNINLIALDETIGAGDHSIQRSDLFYLLANIQTSQQRRRLRQGHARNRIKALPPPGKAPYGYKRGKERYTIDRTTAPIVKEFVEHFLLYGSLRGSVRFLQKKYNKKISASTGKRWLTSPVYRGDLVYQTGDVVQNTHAAIISRDEAAQVDRLLRRNRRMPPRTASAPRSLSGLVKCGACQSSMKVSRVAARRSSQPGKEYLYLTPTACLRQPKCRSIPYDQVLKRTIQCICQDLPPAVSAAALPDIDRIKQGLTAQLSAKQAILDQLPDLVTTGILDPDTAELRSYKLRTEMAALQTQLAQLPPVNLKTIAQVVSIPQFWLDLSETERRFYFREFIREIAIVRHDSEWDVQLGFIF